ncbi:MAG: NADH-quinone oxidoreductase subunit J/K, partial [Synergistetes bacterium]|nr:NADH-quinone oxidoreductase subunit J/K [Synergistota bacterium]
EIVSYGRGLKNIPYYSEVPFFSKQKKVVLRDAGFINPEDIEEYIAIGGYSSVYKVLTQMKPSEVVNEIEASGLRGRGGAGFPTGIKWRLVAQSDSDKKYVICNADEGDPGAYMNRNEMESDPHMIIEGMIIGGYAVGADEGVIYVRAEYPLAIQRLKRAIEQAESYGLLGNDIFGTGFSFRITIARGAGAFVCGEETALIASVEGKTGRPRPRPPFPAEKGLWGKPTLINNVETWSNIPAIIARGSGWFSSIGTKDNNGTKVFSLVGDVERVGLVEVPLGTPISTVVYDIGGGGRKGKGVKAVQTGGPSGGCIPNRLFSTPIDYEHLTALGSIMGSGGIVVMDENTSMVETARFFIGFTNEESCGKCVPCREGLRHMLNILNRLVAGNGRKEDLKTLGELSETIRKASLCGLGQTAPNPVISTLKYFADEYEDCLEGE